MSSNKLRNKLWERSPLHQNALAVMGFKVRLSKKTEAKSAQNDHPTKA
jgi:hypothetical protein